MTTESIKLFTLEEISKHNSENDLWIVINNKVYDLTKFAKVHPGGKGTKFKYFRCITSRRRSRCY